MRTNTLTAAVVVLLTTGLAACAADDARSRSLLADWDPGGDPNIVMASPEATNYGPPGWPFEPGEAIREDDLEDVFRRGRWEGRHYGRLHVPKKTTRTYAPERLARPIVWVVGENGPEGAVPFGPWAMVGSGDDEYRYFGHFPVYYRDGFGPFACCFGPEDIPASLRGIVNPEDHAIIPYKYRDGYNSWLHFQFIADDLCGPNWDIMNCAEQYAAHAYKKFYGAGASWVPVTIPFPPPRLN